MHFTHLQVELDERIEEVESQCSFAALVRVLQTHIGRDLAVHAPAKALVCKSCETDGRGLEQDGHRHNCHAGGVVEQAAGDAIDEEGGDVKEAEAHAN